jgi:L-seryl-tRNA(Ser) seleniumtransferase
MKIYERLGVRRVINGEAELTRLGGSLMPPPVLQAMLEAAESFCDLHELQRKAGERIAHVTRNEAAYVCNGAASGLFLATLACITRGQLRLIAQLPGLAGMRSEVIFFGAQRNPYDLAVRQTGVRVVQVGNTVQTFEWELEAALSERTAAVFYFARGTDPGGALPLDRTISIAHAAGVPVVVDAAAQLPPPENLWRFTSELGADLAVFSGGKGLRGPQSSGLIVGSRELIEACRELGAPHQRIGRPMKVGKEEMCGLVAAVEWFLSLDHPARLADFERQVSGIVEALDGLPGVTAARSFPGVAAQPLPRALVRIDPKRAGTTRDAVQQALWEGDPPIALSAAGEDGLYVNPQSMTPDETTQVVARLRSALLGPLR